MDTLPCGPEFAIFAIVIGGLWLSTENVAAALVYQQRFGAPWFELLSVPVYYSWRLFECRYAFDAYAPALFNNAGLMEAPNGGFGIVVAMFNPTQSAFGPLQPAA